MTNLVCNSINNNTSVQAGNSGHCCQRPFVHPSVGLVNFSLSLSYKTNCPVEYSFRSVLFPLLFVIICSSVPSDLTTFIFCTIVLRHTKTGKCYPVNNLSKSPKFVTNLTPGSTVIRELPLRQVRELPLRQVREIHWDKSGNNHWDKSGTYHWDKSGNYHWDKSGNYHWDKGNTTKTNKGTTTETCQGTTTETNQGTTTETSKGTTTETREIPLRQGKYHWDK